MKMEKEYFIQQYLKEIQDGNAAIFAGAGLSVDAGYVNWKNLLKPLAEVLGLDIDKEHDLVSLAQYHCNSFNRQQLTQKLIENIGIAANPTNNHQILSSLPISTYWTTNYDRLIEKALESEGKISDAKYKTGQLAFTKSNRDSVVYKMHGDIENPQETTLTKDEYEKYPFTHAPFITALSGDLVSKTFLFLGFSFSDPNLDYILSRVRIHFKDNQRNHYCIFKRCALKDFDKEENFQYAKVKQKLVADDLKRFHINVIFVEEYSEIQDILQRIYNLYKRKTIFISGSADEFGEWSKKLTDESLFNLGTALVDKGYRVASGIGLGIGNALISGAISGVYKKQFSHLENHVLMRPFPQFFEDVKQRKQVWEDYRKDIIGRSGIAIFYMGNKIVDGEIVEADGVIAEFEIACSKKVLVLPIGCSGYAAKTLWDRVMQNLELYFPNANKDLKSKIKALGIQTENPNEVISRVIDVLDSIEKG
jgi:hypothetical protein